MTSVKVTILSAGFCTCPEHIAIRGGSRSKIRFPAMFALLTHARFGAMLFDTGYSYRFFEETRRFPSRLYRMATPVTLREEQLAVNQLSTFNLRPADITKIFVSHFHADHIAALGDFSRAKYVYLPQAFDSVANLRGLRAVSRAHLPGLIPADFTQRADPVGSALKPLPPEFKPFTEGYDLLGDESLLAVALPGHASGQMGLFARDESGETYFFVADAAWLNRSIQENRPPHWLANLLFPEPRVYRATLANLHEFQATCPQVRIIPSHCEQTLSQYCNVAVDQGS